MKISRNIKFNKNKYKHISYFINADKLPILIVDLDFLHEDV